MCTAKRNGWSAVPLFTLTLILCCFLLLPAVNALVTTMINATTSTFQEQWLILHGPANYGPETYNMTSVPIIPSQPTLCDDDLAYNFTNRIVLTQRGDCSFFQKSFLAQKYNATGVIVGNVDDGMLVVMSHDPDNNTTKITIPSIIIRKTAFNYLLDMTTHMQPFDWPEVDPELWVEGDGYQGMGNGDDLDDPLDGGEMVHHTSTGAKSSFFETLFPAPEFKPSPLKTFTRRPTATHTRPVPSIGPLSNRLDFYHTPVSDEQHDPAKTYVAKMTRFGPVRVEEYANDDDDDWFNSHDSSSAPVNEAGEHFDDSSDENIFPLALKALFGFISEDSLLPLSAPFPSSSSSSSSSLSSPQHQQLAQSSTSDPNNGHSQSLRVQEDPFDPDQPDAGPFYFILTIDERGERAYPYFDFSQIKFFLLTLILAPLMWILFLFLRWLRLYWGFRCVEELVSNAASSLPVCVFIQTDDDGNILFDSGEGTGSNNIADMMTSSGQNFPKQIEDGDTSKPGQVQNLSPKNNLNNEHTALVNHNYGSTLTSSSSNLLNGINSGAESATTTTTIKNKSTYFNKRSQRFVTVAPTHDLYALLKQFPTVSNTYVAQSIASPDFTLSDESRHLHFKTSTKGLEAPLASSSTSPTSTPPPSSSSTLSSSTSSTSSTSASPMTTGPVNDTHFMSYHAVSAQAISIKSTKNHFRVHSDICNICLDHFVTGDQVKVLGCYHVFHPACIDHFFNSRSNSSSSGGQTTDNVDAEARNIQRRMYANMYLQSSYDFDELGTQDTPSGTGAGAAVNRNPSAGQSCPVCRKSILQTARMNSIIHKKWWIHLFEWICLCSCCCRSLRRQNRQRQRLIEEEQRPVFMTEENLGPGPASSSSSSRAYDPAEYRYSYEITRRGAGVGNNNTNQSAQQQPTTAAAAIIAAHESVPSAQRPTLEQNQQQPYNPNDYSY